MGKKRDQEVARKVLDFLYSQEGFSGMIMDGYYNLPRGVVEKSIRAFFNGDSRGIKEYHKIWCIFSQSLSDFGEYGYSSYLTQEEVDFWQYAQTDDAFWELTSLYSLSDMVKIQKYVDYSIKRIEYFNSPKYKRAQGSKFTSTKSVRKAVFERDGEKCKNCGSSENLTLDHIIPVALDGPNTIENIQVLCRKCNCSKGNRIQK